MKSEMNFDVFANFISMMRSDVDGAIVITDSDHSSQFYEKCVHDNARVIPTYSFAASLHKEMYDRKIDGVVITVNGRDRHENDHLDSFFHPVLGDVTSILIRAEACIPALSEVCGAAWIRAGQKVVNNVVDQAILNSWILEEVFNIVGYFPIVQNFEEFIEWQSFEVSFEALSKKMPGLNYKEFNNIIGQAKASSTTELLCNSNGMYVTSLLAISTHLFIPRGIKPNGNIDTLGLIKLMRTAFIVERFEVDDVYWKMRDWERANKDFPLLKSWRTVDALGGLLDQRYWESDLEKMSLYNNKYGMTAVKLDLDNFKDVNEELGHSGGDEAIKLACSILQRVFGSIGEIYRRGGDELVVLAPRLRLPESQRLCEKLRQEIQEEFIQWAAEKSVLVRPTASIGVVDVEPNIPSAVIIRKMDISQTAAKKNGKNCVVVETCLT